MTRKEKVKYLRDKARELEQEEVNTIKEKYQYLVGKCMRTSHTSYEKIIGIDGAWFSNDLFECLLELKCLHVYLDDTESSINMGYITSRPALEVEEEKSITEEQFNEAFEKCVSRMRKQILSINKIED